MASRQEALNAGRRARRAHLAPGGKHRRTREPIRTVLGREARRSGRYTDRG